MQRLVERLDPTDLQTVTSQGMLARYSFNAHERHCLFVNGHGKRFIEAGYPLGIDEDFEGRGVAVADLDRDGALDLVVRNVARKKLTYFHNEVGAKQNFLRLSLVGTVSNRDAIGAVARIRTGGLRQVRVKMAGNGFQAQSEGTLHFGLGTAEKVEELTVRWPSGKEERFTDLGVNQQLRIVEGQGRYVAERLPNWHPAAAAVPDPTTWKARTLEGKAWRPKDGRLTLVSLWASWCGACRKEVPVLNTVFEKLRGRVDMVGLTFDDTEQGARRFASEAKPKYPLALSSREELEPLLASAFGDGAVNLPSAVLLDERGRPVRTFQGAVGINELERVLRQRPRRLP